MYVTGSDDIAEFARSERIRSTFRWRDRGPEPCPTGPVRSPARRRARTRTRRTPGHAHRDARLGIDVRRLERRRLFGDRHLPGDDERRHDRDRHFHVDRAHPPPDRPTPVLTGAPTAVTDGGAGFSGSVNPDGLADHRVLPVRPRQEIQPGGRVRPELHRADATAGRRLGLHHPRSGAGDGHWARAQRALSRAARRDQQRRYDVRAGRDVHDRDGADARPSDPRPDVQHRAHVRARARLHPRPSGAADRSSPRSRRACRSTPCTAR